MRAALVAVDARLQDRGIDRDLRDRTQIALAEACNNIVEHAYGLEPPGKSADATIMLEIAHDADGLRITLRDRGLPMPEGQLPGVEWPTLDPGDPLTLPEGGFGWPLLRDMAEALCLSRRNGQNILRFQLPRVPTPRQTTPTAL